MNANCPCGHGHDTATSDAEFLANLDALIAQQDDILDAIRANLARADLLSEIIKEYSNLRDTLASVNRTKCRCDYKYCEHWAADEETWDAFYGRNDGR